MNWVVVKSRLVQGRLFGVDQTYYSFMNQPNHCGHLWRPYFRFPHILRLGGW